MEEIEGTGGWRAKWDTGQSPPLETEYDLVHLIATGLLSHVSPEHGRKTSQPVHSPPKRFRNDQCSREKINTTHDRMGAVRCSDW